MRKLISARGTALSLVLLFVVFAILGVQSEIRLLNLTFCRLSVSASRILGL